MATVAMGFGQFQRFLSCEVGAGFHTCDLGIELYNGMVSIFLYTGCSKQTSWYRNAMVFFFFFWSFSTESLNFFSRSGQVNKHVKSHGKKQKLKWSKVMK